MISQVVPFTELLQRDGAERPRRERGKWRCGHCEGKSWTLSANLERELFFCHRCGWKGNRRTLERELRIESPKPTPSQVRGRRLIREMAERFLEWTRRQRIQTAALLRDLGRYELDWRQIMRQQLATGQHVDEKLWEKLQSISAWQERAEARYEQLCGLEGNGSVLYREFLHKRQEEA